MLPLLRLTITVLDPALRSRIDRFPSARELIADFRILNIDFYPRESHLITLRDPWSFPVLFHPACNHLIREHLEALAQKVSCRCPDQKFRTDPYRLYLCVSLSENIPRFDITSQEYPPTKQAFFVRILPNLSSKSSTYTPSIIKISHLLLQDHLAFSSSWIGRWIFIRPLFTSSLIRRWRLICYR